MMGFKTAKAKRSLTYSAVILLVISIFILTYWYYFIPNNRRTIHKNGFLILQTIAGNIEDITNARRSLYENYYTDALSKEKSRKLPTKQQREKSIDSLLKKNQIKASVHISPMDSIAKEDSDIRIEHGNLIVWIYNNALTEKVEFSENINPLIESVLSTQRSELFQSYLLGEMKDTSTELLYNDRDLAVRSDQGIDSLLPKGAEAYLTGIRDLSLHEVDQKVFYFPFRVQETQLMIGGFVNSKEYNASLRQVPFYFLYPLVIIFLLLLVSLPIIKFYIMDPNEQVRVSDVILFGLSVFTCAAFLTLMIIHYLLWKGEEERVRQRLGALSGQIKKSFIEEIQRSYKELTLLDKYKNDNPPEKAEHVDYSAAIKKFVRDSAYSPSRYFYFERITWIDSSKEQKIRADLYSEPVFAKISNRKYFDLFKNGAPYSLPGDQDVKIGLEPIYSRTNAEFNITISKKDTATGGFIVTMALQPNSVLNAILPAGYGFCIIDEQGNVQVHSDKDRNLNENFFQKIEPDWDVRSAVATRQDKEVNNVVAYGKMHQMRVQPLDDLPFHLITFYDKRFIVPVNMRILVFALAFCFLSFITCMVLWWAMTQKYKTEHRLVYCRLDIISWITPKPAEKTYYFHAFGFVFYYIVILLGYVLLNRHYTISNFSILVLLIVTPINIFFSLTAIRAAFMQTVNNAGRAERIKERINVWKSIGAHLAISLLVYYITKKIFGIAASFLYFQLGINFILWVYALFTGPARKLSPGPRTDYLKGYDRLATSLVVVLAGLPSAMFTWYAHNQEIIQTVKRQQLHLAHAIRDRSEVIRQMKGVNDDSLPVPDFYLDSLQLSKGIYTIYNDSICYRSDSGTTAKDVNIFDGFYFSVVENVRNPYYKQQPYAALTNFAYDTSWLWKRQDSFIHFSYYPSLPALKKQDSAYRHKMLAIRSTIPPRFIVLNSWKGFIPLLIVIGLLIRALHVWLKMNSHQIFLIRHIYGTTRVNNKTGLVAAYYNDKTLKCNEYQPSDKAFFRDREKLYQYEEAIVADVHNRDKLYNDIWNTCSEKEQFLLYNMAKDGLINYKNTMEIIELMKKGLLIKDNERIKPFSPGFRAFILGICTEENENMARIQKKYLENSTWQLFRMPLVVLLIGIAVLVFFTQQYVFDKLLLLAGGISTLTTLIVSVMGAGKHPEKQTG